MDKQTEVKAIVTCSSKNVLVIVSGCPSSKNFSDWNVIIPSTTTLSNGASVRVQAATWEDINLTAYCDSNTPLVVHIFDRKLNKVVTFCPHLILVRAEVRGFTFGVDFRNFLFGIRFAQIPTINSTAALLHMMDRPWLHAALAGIKAKVGADKFPLINRKFKMHFRY